MSATVYGLGRLVFRQRVRVPPVRGPVARRPMPFGGGDGRGDGGGGGDGGGRPPMGPFGGLPPLMPFVTPVFDWQPPPVRGPLAVIPDADPIFSPECLWKAMKAYLDEHYYTAVGGLMGLDSNTPPQPKADYCSNFGLAMAQWEIKNDKAKAEKEADFKQRVAEFKAWSPFMAAPVNDVTLE
jgi:hypothetical protein